MKTITFFKRVLASAALVSVCGFACATNNGKQFVHNDTMEKEDSSAVKYILWTILFPAYSVR